MSVKNLLVLEKLKESRSMNLLYREALILYKMMLVNVIKSVYFGFPVNVLK